MHSKKMIYTYSPGLTESAFVFNDRMLCVVFCFVQYVLLSLDEVDRHNLKMRSHYNQLPKKRKKNGGGDRHQILTN